MAENLSDFTASNLTCTESTNTCFDGFDCNATNGDDDDQNSQNHSQDSNFINKRSIFPMGFFPFQTVSEELLREMAVKEGELLPKHDYLNRLRSGDLDSRVRREALDWILKAHANYRFGPMSFCLSMNYLDRFLSVYELPKGKDWTVQLLAVACLSLAAKMEESEVPLLVELQVGEPKYVFEAKTIQKMELLVLGTLKWRMQCLTPCSFIDYFLTKVNDDQLPSATSIFRSVQLLFSTIKATDFLEFKPSEIAAAVAISVSREDEQAQNIDKAISCFIHVEKERVLNCVELIKELSAVSSVLPHSPDGVLDAAYLSYNNKTEDITVRSCASSSHNTSSPSSVIKRRKQQDTSEPSSPQLEDYKS
ncbi:hypothetical protein AB3S75_001738 [Citrus x aurantiifolia]